VLYHSSCTAILLFEYSGLSLVVLPIVVCLIRSRRYIPLEKFRRKIFDGQSEDGRTNDLRETFAGNTGPTISPGLLLYCQPLTCY